MDAKRRASAWTYSRSRAAILVTAAVAVLGVGVGPAAAASAPPTQGMYDQCAPSETATCAEHLQRLGAAGFKAILNYTVWSGSEADLRAYAETAAASGVSIIWPLNDPAWRHGGLVAKYPQLATSCGCEDDAGFERYIVGLVSALPATWGYYVGDELAATELPSAQALADRVRALDPNHHLLYMANGNRPSPAAEIAPFSSVADVVGADSYPIGLGGSSSTVGIVGRAVNQPGTTATGRAMALQAFDWSKYPSQSGVTTERWPTRDEMRASLDAAVSSADPSLVLWFSLNAIDTSADPYAHWSDVVAAAFGAPTAQAASTGATKARAAQSASRRHQRVGQIVMVKVHRHHRAQRHLRRHSHAWYRRYLATHRHRTHHKHRGHVSQRG